MKKETRITVLMSVYNGEQYLREAIDSILNQTYPHFEFVIYDDCSTDNTRSIIESYSDNRIIYRRNEENKGLTYNLADGIARSDTDYIARMDADDIAYPNRLATQLEWMDKHQDISILGTSISYFQKELGDLGIARQPEDDATIKATLFIDFTLMHPSIMIRRADLVIHNLNYDPNYRCSQDHALYLDCIRAGLRFANLPEPYLHMRAHENSISKAKHDYQQEFSQRARLVFLQKTGLINGCTNEEIEVYNNFASGVFPDTVIKIHAYERFVNKIYYNPVVCIYFNKDLLRSLMADKLSNEAYHAINKSSLRRSALAARRSYLIRYGKPWSIKKKLKFIIKKILSVIIKL